MRTQIKNTTESFKHLLAFQRSPYSFFEQIKPNDLSEVKRLKMGTKDFYFFYDPEHAKYILQDNKDNYPKSDLVLKKILPLSGPTGLIQLNDEGAKTVRQSAGVLMDPRRAMRLGKFVEGFVEEEFDRFDKAASDGSAVDLKPFLTHLVLRTAGVFILDEDIQTKASKLNHAFVELNRMAGESLSQLIPRPYSFKQKKYLKTIHDELDIIISESLNQDRISLLHELNKKNFPISFLRDQVKAFMFAGYDTTASSLIFAVDSIARNLDVQDKIKAEQGFSYRDSKYSQATYKESLRLYPSAYFLPRQAANDDEIGGMKINAGGQAFISIRHIHRHPDYFENPNEFIPERFLQKLPHSHVFLPFGAGGRICIGAPLAIMEATVVLKKLCERYKLHPVNPNPPEIEGLITAHTKSPLEVRFERRLLC